MTYERLPLKPWHYGEPMDCLPRWVLLTNVNRSQKNDENNYGSYG